MNTPSALALRWTVSSTRFALPIRARVAHSTSKTKTNVSIVTDVSDIVTETIARTGKTLSSCKSESGSKFFTLHSSLFTSAKPTVNPHHDFSRYMNAGSTDPRRDSAI